jgi:hypothetical protein
MRALLSYGPFFVVLLVCLTSCQAEPEGIELTFQVDLTESLAEIKEPNSVGITGAAPFLDRYDALPMTFTGRESVYQTSFLIPDSLAGTAIRYRFIVDDNFIENERYGWRQMVIPSESTLLPLDKFNDMKGTTGALAQPSLPIPVLFADSPQEDNYFKTPFKGVTTNGTPLPGLFSIAPTGISTRPIREAVNSFLDALSEEQRRECTFPITSDEWRRWHNIEIYDREGIALFEMTGEQKVLAFDILNKSLSPKGVRKAKDIMTMEDYLKELTARIGRHSAEDVDRLGSDHYYFTVMGTPSETEPWGWQIDGHHLVINYFVLGNQVVMTPTFMGSEPNFIEEGPNAGLRTFEEEENKGLAFYRSLDDQQKETATLWQGKNYEFAQTEAFKDNATVPYRGLRMNDLPNQQKALLQELIDEYLSRMPPARAAIKRKEISEHHADTWFSWVGGSGEEDPFYYRIQSPVILIEFDHHAPVFLVEKGQPNPGPVKWHVHTVVRTPNGNDYGKDLLRQHLEERHH